MQQLPRAKHYFSWAAELTGSYGPKAEIEVVLPRPGKKPALCFMSPTTVILEVVDWHRHCGGIDIALRRVRARSSGP